MDFSRNLILPTRLKFYERRKQFAVCHTHRPLPVGGTEVEFAILGSWLEPQGQWRTTEIWETQREKLFSRAAQYFRRDHLNAKGAKPWPMPSGNLPVHWSAEAMGKTLLPFIRAFEGDLVLGELSFLNKASLPLETALQIAESSSGTDHEGIAHQPFTFFRKGQPTRLACDESTAKHFEVAPTGHCRRQSYRDKPTVGFWHPVVGSEAAEANLLQRMDRGIHVTDVEVLSFQPATGEIALNLKDCRLVHQGELGEALESTRLDTSLLQLIPSMKAFSQTQATTVMPIRKQKQSFLTQITAPEALSPELMIPGTVPSNQYW